MHTATYDADGLRVAKEIPTPTGSGLSNPATFQYIWDGKDLLNEYVQHDPTTRREQVIHTVKPEGEFGRVINSYKPLDLGIVLSDLLFEFQYDALGTTSHPVGFGEPLGAKNPISLPAIRCDASGKFIFGPGHGYFGGPHRYFVGEWGYQPDMRHDGDNAYASNVRLVDYYIRERTYDPSQARWLSQDPIGFAAGDVNLYRYVGNNPVLLMDPSGKLTWVNEEPVFTRSTTVTGFPFGTNGTTALDGAPAMTYPRAKISFTCICLSKGSWVLNPLKAPKPSGVPGPAAAAAAQMAAAAAAPKGVTVTHHSQVYLESVTWFNELQARIPAADGMPPVYQWALQAEDQHVQDFIKWGNGQGKIDATAAEVTALAKSYTTEAECNTGTVAIIKPLLIASIVVANEASIVDRDDSGEHLFGGPNMVRFD